MRLRRRPAPEDAVEITGPPASGPCCRAPGTSLHLDPRGVVRACCMNQYQRLGTIGPQTLREIWDGRARRDLEARAGSGDLTLGCELCKVRVDAGSAETAYLHVYDDLTPVDGWPTQLELALSNACNLQCVMCNGDLSSAIRIHREHRPPLPPVYGDAFFDELDDFLPHLDRVILLGGEPFLGAEPLRVVERLVELDLAPNCHVTTNGTQWSDRVRRLVESLPMHVAVSVDGATEAVTRAIRIGADHDLVRANVARFRDAARANGSDCSISFSLMRGNAHELGAVLGWADELDVDVFVNDVTYPPSFSLHHLPGAELDDLLGRLEAEDRARARPLQRNRARWEATLSGLRHLRSERQERPVVLRRDPRRAARAAVAATGVPVSEVVADGQQIVRQVSPDPSDVGGIDLRPVVGSSIADMIDPIKAALGRTVATELVQGEDGVEVRHMVFDDGVRRRRVVAALATTDDDRQHWYLGVEDDDDGPGPASGVRG